MHLYLASPADSSNSKARSLAQELRLALRRARLPFFDPVAGWTSGSSEFPALVARDLMQTNLAALDSARAVVAVVEGPTIGVIMELERARAAGKPCFVVSTEYSHHFALQYLAGDEGGIHEDVESLMDALGLHDFSAPDFVEVFLRRDERADGLPFMRQQKEGDVGLDLYISQAITIPPREWRGVMHDVHAAPPAGVWFLIHGRSSALHKHGLIVQSSVIDTGYRGDLRAFCYNTTDNLVSLERGERVAQLLPLPRMAIRMVEVGELPSSERGDTGFGSTGR